MEGKVKEVAGKAVGSREPGHDSHRLDAHGKIEAAYADVRNVYKKAV
jgi:uncharacterized protein YjbJ (UPF0337 family)